MEIVLTENLVITNDERFQKTYEQIFGEQCDVDELIIRVQNLENVVYYFDNRFRCTTAENAIYSWIDVGRRNSYGNPVFISLVKTYGVFCGYIIGYPGYLMKRFLEYGVKNPTEFKENVYKFVQKYEENNGNVELEEIPEDQQAGQPHADIADIVAEARKALLLDKWETMEGFRRFLLILGNRARYYVSKNMDEYYVKNNIGSIIINTGLLNKYGQYIHMMYRLHVKDDYYKPYILVTSKTIYVENGFSNEDAAKILKPVTFIGDDTPQFSTNMAEYDSSFDSLTHCIAERKDRFPESVQNISELYLAQKLSQELAIGLSIHRCGGSYAKPIYKAKENEINWVLPLHINADINETPELVMVISKRGAFYDTRTILPYDSDIRDGIRAVSLYADLW